MQMAYKYAKSASAVALIVLASACGGGKLEEARHLAVVGGEAGGKLQTAAAKMEGGFVETIRQDGFLVSYQTRFTADKLPAGRCSYVGYARSVKNPPVSKPLNPDDVEKILLRLDARRDLAGALVKTYGGFAALTQYDAGGEAVAGVQGVVDAANKMRVAVGGLKPLQPVVGKILDVGARAIMEQVQLAKLRAASAALRDALAGYEEALVNGRAAGVATMEDTIRQQYATIIELWRYGKLSANQLAETVVLPSRLNLAFSKGMVITAADEGMCHAVRNDLEMNRARALRNVDRDYDAQIAVLKELQKVHLAFEEDGVVDLTFAKLLVDQLLSIANELSKKE